ncbi:sugar ABC transporter substrate-binding protein [Mesorhizobium sp. AR07]|uniref:ABC transporter substrate-binding protein n=1 Tax=Mesorhizobium sp. AR07 TaxID=2865838 RepID=UPI00215E98C8|nr:sugar ABC transporter substrate-binding protein [Mesorhizobium sp. AR07]UVK44004.1 sugar ABC transporter substrate-binding protein [Mesorhizobium sp. AR07]
MKNLIRTSIIAAAGLLSTAAFAETLTIATVNNGDMIRMQKLTDDFTKANPDIQLQWVTLEENVLRQKVTVDIATKAGQFDILTIGTYEVPLWAKQGWLLPLQNLGPDYDVEDLIPAIRNATSEDGKLYAAPFYAESSLLMYRKDLFAKAGLTMPEKPDWDFIGDAARKLTDRANDVNGICLRGKAGWGENMASLTSLANSFGAKWFDKNWKPQFDQQSWKDTLGFYVKLMKDAGPAGASSNGFNENLALFQQGKCAMWIDASVAASFVSDPKQSTVADKAAFAVSPDEKGSGNRGNWLWAWTLAIPAGSHKAESAEKFIAWATSKHYIELVAEKEGWANVPPGTRKSLYENQKYLDAAPFAKMTLDAMLAAGEGKQKTQYPFWQYVILPEYQAVGNAVGQVFSSALTGDTTVDAALQQAQNLTERAMAKAGYPK